MENLIDRIRELNDDQIKQLGYFLDELDTTFNVDTEELIEYLNAKFVNVEFDNTEFSNEKFSSILREYLIGKSLQVIDNDRDNFVEAKISIYNLNIESYIERRRSYLKRSKDHFIIYYREYKIFEEEYYMEEKFYTNEQIQMIIREFKLKNEYEFNLFIKYLQKLNDFFARYIY